jgi:hypothetical protein
MNKGIQTKKFRNQKKAGVSERKKRRTDCAQETTTLNCILQQVLHPSLSKIPVRSDTGSSPLDPFLSAKKWCTRIKRAKTL